MRLLSLLILLVSSTAWAGGYGPPTSRSDADAAAAAHASQAQGQVQDQSQGQGQAQQQRLTSSQNVVASIEQGAVSVSDSQSIETNVHADAKRNAPAVTVMPSPTTAEMMVCFGLGGSGTEGAATGAWCRLQRELYATHMGTRLATMHLYSDAAVAYCSRKLHYRQFNGPGPGETTCRTQMEIGYRSLYPPVVRLTGPPIPVKPEPASLGACDERVKRCEEQALK